MYSYLSIFDALTGTGYNYLYWKTFGCKLTFKRLLLAIVGLSSNTVIVPTAHLKIGQRQHVEIYFLLKGLVVIELIGT